MDRAGRLPPVGGGGDAAARVGRVALSHSLSGLEFGVAIPASLGGSVRMNAGAHGHSLDEVLSSVEVFLTAQDEVRVLPVEEVGFRYRATALPDGAVVLGATVSLRPGDAVEIRRLMDEAREWRRATQPLAEPNCAAACSRIHRETMRPGSSRAWAGRPSGGRGPVSEKHSNFIVAGPGSTARDVLALMTSLRERVLREHGVELEPEVHVVGTVDA